MVRKRNVERYRSMEPPGRTHLDDSIDASSENPDRTDDGYSFSTGYESSAATRIGDDDRTDVERLRALNEGRHRSDGEHSVREARRDKKRIAQAICSSLPLADREQQKVVSVVETIDYARFGNQKGIPGVTLGVVAVVIDERHRDATNFSDLVQRTDEFRSACDSNEISMSDLGTIKEKVRNAIQEGGAQVIAADRVSKRDPALPGPTPPSEKPKQFWENCAPKYWVTLAKSWDRVDDGLKEAIPGKYRNRVKQLRRWKPWEDEQNEPESDHTVEDGDQESTDYDNLSLEEEVDKVIDEMIEASSE